MPTCRKKKEDHSLLREEVHVKMKEFALMQDFAVSILSADRISLRKALPRFYAREIELSRRTVPSVISYPGNNAHVMQSWPSFLVVIGFRTASNIHSAIIISRRYSRGRIHFIARLSPVGVIGLLIAMQVEVSLRRTGQDLYEVTANYWRSLCGESAQA
jgi:hypothetical protein